ncbi:MAG: hypothetical protein ACE5GL_05000 [Calditrichia bacterium]
MGELITILFIILCVFLAVKLLVILAKAGLFLLVLPFKVFFAIIGTIFFVLFFSAFSVPLLIAAAFVLFPLALIIGGLILLVR